MNTNESGARPYLLLGFILNGCDWIFQNMEIFDFYFGIVLKITSLISFFIFMFLNWPRIQTRARGVYRGFFK